MRADANNAHAYYASDRLCVHRHFLITVFHRLIKTQIGHARDFSWYRGQRPSPARVILSHERVQIHARENLCRLHFNHARRGRALAAISGKVPSVSGVCRIHSNKRRPKGFFFVQHGTNKLHSVGSDHAFHVINSDKIFFFFSCYWCFRASSCFEKELFFLGIYPISFKIIRAPVIRMNTVNVWYYY